MDLLFILIAIMLVCLGYGFKDLFIKREEKTYKLYKGLTAIVFAAMLFFIGYVM